MQFEIARARRLYAAAWPGIALLAPDSRFGVAAAATVYRGILGRSRRRSTMSSPSAPT